MYYVNIQLKHCFPLKKILNRSCFEEEKNLRVCTASFSEFHIYIPYHLHHRQKDLVGYRIPTIHQQTE